MTIRVSPKWAAHSVILPISEMIFVETKVSLEDLSLLWFIVLILFNEAQNRYFWSSSGSHKTFTLPLCPLTASQSLLLSEESNQPELHINFQNRKSSSTNGNFTSGLTTLNRTIANPFSSTVFHFKFQVWLFISFLIQSNSQSQMDHWGSQSLVIAGHRRTDRVNCLPETAFSPRNARLFNTFVSLHSPRTFDDCLAAGSMTITPLMSCSVGVFSSTPLGNPLRDSLSIRLFGLSSRHVPSTYICNSSQSTFYTWLQVGMMDWEEPNKTSPGEGVKSIFRCVWDR